MKLTVRRWLVRVLKGAYPQQSTQVAWFGYCGSMNGTSRSYPQWTNDRGGHLS